MCLPLKERDRSLFHLTKRSKTYLYTHNLKCLKFSCAGRYSVIQNSIGPLSTIWEVYLLLGYKLKPSRDQSRFKFITNTYN